ncbi:MAG: hypothetical protein ACUVUG_01320 [Candidatus Aminicenantia bacterium]
MKRIFLIGFWAVLIVLISDCGSPEKNMLDRYFEAVKFGDKMTMSTIAYEPIAIEAITKWRLVSLSQEEKKSLPLNELFKKQDELKAKRDELISQVADLNDKVSEAKANLAKARGAAKKKAEQEVAEAEEEYKEGRANYEVIQKEWNKLKAEIDKEKALFNLSTGIEWPEGIEIEGDMGLKEAMIEVTSSAEVKNYKVILRKYSIKTPEGRPLTGRWIIEKFILK